MSIDLKNGGVSPEVTAELEEAARYAVSGVRDPVVMREAATAMDTMREAFRRKHGEVNVAVDLVREVRDEA